LRGSAETVVVPTLLLDHRPVSSDPILLHAFARRGRPLAFADLLRAMEGTGARISDVMELLAAGLANGQLRPWGFREDAAGRLAGGLLYELTEPGRRIVAADRLAA
jgi:hypothetical protein